MSRLNEKQEAFAQEVVRNGGDKVAAFKASGWSWEGFSKGALSVEADKKYNHPKISLRIAELQEVADEVAMKEFSISIEQRLRWLKEVAEAGLSTYVDMQGNQRRENLPATTGAVKEINSMLGDGSDDNETGDALTINFNVSEPVRDVKVTRGE